MEYFLQSRIFGRAQFYVWNSPFKPQFSLKRLYLGLKILNMTFCQKLETAINHALLRKIFSPKSCSRKFFTFLMSKNMQKMETLVVQIIFALVTFLIFERKVCSLKQIKVSNFQIFASFVQPNKTWSFWCFYSRSCDHNFWTPHTE